MNEAQIAVLRWIGDGCPAGVFDDWSHRSSARALSNRKLVSIEGHGMNWHAELTSDGEYYLEHGEYPARNTSQDPPKGETLAISDAPNKPAKAPKVKPSVKRRRGTAPNDIKTGPTQHMMMRLTQAGASGIVITHAEKKRYAALIGAAKRHGKIPTGMHITMEKRRRDGEWVLSVTLEPLPAWQTRALPDVPIPADLDDACPVTLAFKDSGTFQVKGEPRERALLLTEALVTEAERRGMRIKAKVDEPVFEGDNSYRSMRHDVIEVQLGSDRYRLWFCQETLQQEHVPTRSEIAWAWRGRLFPDFDEIPDSRLSLVLSGDGGTFFADSWKDADKQGLEELLPQILEEICLRHHRMEDTRLRREEERRRDQERTEAEQERLERAAEDLKARRAAARVQAMEEYRRRQVIEAMHAQSENWRMSCLMRAYADAIEVAASNRGHEERQPMERWAADIRTQAKRENPLTGVPSRPDIPEPPDDAIEPLIAALLGNDQ